MKQVYMPIAIIFSATTARAMDINAYPDCHDEIASFQSNDKDSHRNGDDKVSHIDLHMKLYDALKTTLRAKIWLTPWIMPITWYISLICFIFLKKIF